MLQPGGSRQHRQRLRAPNRLRILECQVGQARRQRVGDTHSDSGGGVEAVVSARGVGGWHTGGWVNEWMGGWVGGWAELQGRGSVRLIHDWGGRTWRSSSMQHKQHGVLPFR